MGLIKASTEDKIKEAAVKVFLEKGYDGATTREIANEAGMNCALMNYYFRSKEKLFHGVFDEMFQLFFQGMSDILGQNLPLKEKIVKIIDHDFEMFQKNPQLANFIINEIHRCPERISGSKEKMTEVHLYDFESQIKESVSAGHMIDIDFKHILMLIKSNIQFMFHSKEITKHICKMDETQYDNFSLVHKELVKSMIIGYIFPTRSIEDTHLQLQHSAL